MERSVIYTIKDVTFFLHYVGVFFSRYEKVLRLYFSHPSVEGIMLWGFWDHDSNPLQALVHGNSYTVKFLLSRGVYIIIQIWALHTENPESETLQNALQNILERYEGARKTSQKNWTLMKK